ncbi:hypothetical protein PPERSA_08490 [Pseudocohnilembus persalinus]|uniref:Vacuolar sorting receptor thioredoxin-like domain-containing protein n=1 Tax=Pseudocohnilembus persalinus TaxID=266149 RepID=A0A0V0R6H5_PSEPJ|nr:hypothetical protein PPERSA_08490 [Pseudocohnilembus persalinus]|eukprot:KRX10087.1 hypothetical protein PPERSA_08490 [Pseudocohnilembus persalinus]
MKRLLQIIFVLILLSQYNCTLKILGPKEIISEFFQQNKIFDDYSISNFGFVPYGSSFRAPIQLAEPFSACQQLKMPKKSKNNNAINQNNQFILIVQKTTECSFVTQVRNAEQFGASMADDTYQHSKEVIPIDQNGNGQNIGIPSILVSKSLGDTLVKSIKYTNKNLDGQQVKIQVSFKVRKYKVTDMKLFVDIENLSELIFIRNFGSQFVQLIDYVNFTPIYDNYYCPDCELKDFQEIIPQCLGGGRYCQFDPDEDGPLTGRDFIEEQIRQLCIQKEFGSLYWWNYMRLYQKNCYNTEDLYKCSIQQQNILVDPFYEKLETIKQCYDNSFDQSSGSSRLVQKNIILEENRKNIKDYGYINQWPGLSINNIPYRGSLYTNNVLEAICASLSQPPEFCNYYNHLFQSQHQEIGSKEPNSTEQEHTKDENYLGYAWILAIALSAWIIFSIIMGGYMSNDEVSKYVQIYENQLSRKSDIEVQKKRQSIQKDQQITDAQNQEETTQNQQIELKESLNSNEQ